MPDNAMNDKNELYRLANKMDAEYPSRLKETMGVKAPAKVCYIGNLALLEKKAIGFCGSRKASEKGLETAKDCAAQLAEQGIVVVSGYAAGVDQMAHKTALESGGQTIIVLPEGIENFRIRNSLASVWDWSRVLVISEFEPNTPWKGFHAMQRNKTIVALSDAMIVIEAGEKGGTIEAGRSTLRMNRPLYVAEYENMSHALGNNELLRKGAHKLNRSSSTRRANLKCLLADITQAASPIGKVHGHAQHVLL